MTPQDMTPQEEQSIASRPRSARVLTVIVNLLIWIVWAALAIFTVSAALFFFGLIPDSWEVPIPVRVVIDGGAQSDTVPRLLSVEGVATVLVGGHTPGIAIAFVLLCLLYFGWLLYGTYQLRRVVLAIGDGRPFAAEVPRSFVRLGLVLLLGWPVNSLGAWLFAHRVAALIAQPGLRLSAVVPERDINWLIAGLLCLLLAAAFRTGCRLQTENDLTI